jgi:hypothetical protein
MPRCRALLGVSPWTWPADDDAIVAALGAPPSLAPGSAALVAWRRDGVELWRFDAAADRAPLGAEFAPLKEDAEAAFWNAADAVDRWLPFGVGEVHRLRGATRRALLAGVVSTARSATALGVLDGPSFGLAFALALASRVLRRPVAADVVASACISPDGQLKRVDGIDQKLAGVRELAPRVRRFLVAAEQFTVAEIDERNARFAPLEVVPCAELLDAVKMSLGAPYATLQADDVAALVLDLFALALRDRGSTLSWRSARDAARELASLVNAGDDVQRLRFVDMIAGRHLAHEPPLEWPDLGFVERQRRLQRIQLLAHLVQEHHDLGWPEAAWLHKQIGCVFSFDSDGQVDLRDASSDELMLAGAWGRFLALQGRLHEAFAWQTNALRAFMDNGQFEEVSHPLCEALRLAALLGNQAAFDSLLRDKDEFARLRPRASQNGFVELAMGRGMIQLGRGAAGVATLRLLLASGRRILPHVRAGAVRWLVFAGAQTQEEARGVLDGLDASTRQWTGALMAIDAAADDAAAAGPLQELASCADTERVVAHLLQAYSSARDIARFFPY